MAKKDYTKEEVKQECEKAIIKRKLDDGKFYFGYKVASGGYWFFKTKKEALNDLLSFYGSKVRV